MNRVYKATDIRNQSQLAVALGRDRSTISSNKAKDNVPRSWIMPLAQKYDLNPEWLRTGQGQPKMVSTQEPGTLDAFQQDHGFDPSSSDRNLDLTAKLLWVLTTLLGQDDDAQEVISRNAHALRDIRNRLAHGAVVVPADYLAALLAGHEKDFRKLDMDEPQIIQHLKGILDARHKQILKEQEELASRGLRDSSASSGYGGLHEPAKPWPYGPKDPDNPPGEQNSAEPSTDDLNLEQR